MFLKFMKLYMWPLYGNIVNFTWELKTLFSVVYTTLRMHYTYAQYSHQIMNIFDELIKSDCC